MNVKAGGITIWNGDGTGLQTNSLWWAASLACRSFVLFGDGSKKEYDPAEIIRIDWQEIKKLGRKVPLDGLGPDFKGKDDDIYSVFKGAVLTIEGVDLRLRTRALAGHYGESFDDGYPPGRMRLFIDALERKIKYDKLLDKVKELERTQR